MSRTWLRERTLTHTDPACAARKHLLRAGFPPPVSAPGSICELAQREIDRRFVHNGGHNTQRNRRRAGVGQGRIGEDGIFVALLLLGFALMALTKMGAVN